MEAIKFKQVNCVLAEDQPEYKPLPVFRGSEVTGEVISCWRPSIIERLMILFTGRIWLSTWTFGHAFQPTLLEAGDPFKRKTKELEEELRGLTADLKRKEKK